MIRYHSSLEIKCFLPFFWRIVGGTLAIGGINGIAAAIGGKTLDIVDDVNAAIALAAFAARLSKMGIK